MTDNRILLAITGEMGSGKTTLAKYFVDKHDFQLVRISGKIKEIILSLDIELGRKIQQDVGELFRKYDDDVWVKQAIKEVNNSNKSIIIDDIRRLNEYQNLKPLGFKFIRLTASDESRRSRLQSRDDITITDEQWNTWKKHMTETQVFDIPVDYTIDNSVDKNNLFKQVDEILSFLKVL